MGMFSYKINSQLTIDEVVAVLAGSGIRRPVTDRERIGKMFDAADLVVSAWYGNRLVGVARSLTDWCYCCYLSDLAVHKEFQNNGIGKELVARTRRQIGEQCMLLLLSAPSAMGYYPRLNMENLSNAFIFHRIS